MNNRYSFKIFSIELLLWCFSLVFLLPIAMVILNSLKTQVEANRMNLSFPAKLKWENYLVVIEQAKLVPAYMNSILISMITVIAGIVLAAMASFVLSRNRTKINGLVNKYFLIGMIAPISIIPTIKIMQMMHVMNTFQGIILLFTALALSFNIFLYYGFIASVPKELDEAAITDGCGGVRLFLLIIFPILKPVTVTLGILTFTSVWNDFMIPLYFLNNSSKWPITMAVYNFYGTYVSSWNLVSADIILTILPVILVFVLGQKHIISGMTAGAIKG